MFAVPSFFGYNTTFVSTPVATAATGVGSTSFTANWNAFAGAQYYLLDVSTSSSFSSFVFQDRVIYTNSYAVTGLTASTTYYYRVRASTTYETDAAAFFTRVTSAGGTLTTTEQQAVNSLVIQMKADGIWTAMKAIYPMVGASAAACAQNLKSSSFTGSFSSGWTFASTGVTPNGTSAYMDTALNWNTNTNLDNVSFGSYLRTLGTVTGYYGVSNGTNQFAITNTRAACDFYINENGNGTVATLAAGLHSATRKNSTQQSMYVNGVLNVTGSRTSNSKTNANFWFGGTNGFSSFSSQQLALGFISDGLDGTQNSNFYTAVQAFQTTIGRQV